MNKVCGFMVTDVEEHSDCTRSGRVLLPKGTTVYEFRDMAQGNMTFRITDGQSVWTDETVTEHVDSLPIESCYAMWDGYSAAEFTVHVTPDDFTFWRIASSEQLQHTTFKVTYASGGVFIGRLAVEGFELVPVLGEGPDDSMFTGMWVTDLDRSELDATVASIERIREETE